MAACVSDGDLTETSSDGSKTRLDARVGEGGEGSGKRVKSDGQFFSPNFLR